MARLLGPAGHVHACDVQATALESLLPVIARGGVLTVVGYPGHAGGAEELGAVADWARRLPSAHAHACHWQSLNAAVPVPS
ncbi:MAG: class I SAM-dependent methyltransferase [Verrucomicrobiales bacterium]